jgi:hypothetical protein
MVGKVILLHAGKKYDKRGAVSMLNQKLYAPPSPAASPMGIVGAFIVDRVIYKDGDDPLLDSPWFIGPYGWVIDKVQAFDQPIDCKGKQGLWTPEPEILNRCIEQLNIKE